MADLLAGRDGLLSDAAATLTEAGQGEGRRLALRLLADLSGRTPAEAALAPSPDATTAERFREAVARVAAGEPPAYVTGLAGFRRLTLRCDRRALIPRPETEGLVERALAAVDTGRALDLGTGSGCIALSLAQEGRFDQVTGVDIDARALGLARENAARSTLAVRWLEGDWLAPVAGERFDLIVTNPPYIATAELNGLDASVRDWEPRAALDGGPDGLRAAEAILTGARPVLADRGWLFMEVDAARAPRTAAAAQSAGWLDVTVHEDLFGRARYLSARRGA